jgi:hypothetical protein
MKKGDLYRSRRSPNNIIMIVNPSPPTFTTDLVLCYNFAEQRYINYCVDYIEPLNKTDKNCPKK